MRLHMKYLAFSCILLVIRLSAQDDFTPFLYYQNRNQSIDYLYFFDRNYKLARSVQHEPGPLTMYLLNEKNLICDTLDEKILPEFVFFDRDRHVYISSGKSFHHYILESGKLVKQAKFDASSYRLNHPAVPKDSWRIVYLDGKMIGLKGFGKKTEVISIDTMHNKYEVLIPSGPYRKIPRQRMINFNYFYTSGNFYVFVVPYQRYYKISLTDLAVSEFVYPDAGKSIWYFFLDHTTGIRYSVRDEDGTYSLYSHSDKNQLIWVMTLPDFPSAVVDGFVHIVREETEGRAHYLVPVSDIDRVNTERNFFILDEIKIR
jgi:hypothetical protein